MGKNVNLDPDFPLNMNIWTDIYGIIEFDHVVWTYPRGIYIANIVLWYYLLC